MLVGLTGLKGRDDLGYELSQKKESIFIEVCPWQVTQITRTLVITSEQQKQQRLIRGSL